MVFPITMSNLPLEFDSLAALKCTHWQPGAHRVYTMARLYLLNGNLQASLCAFERGPAPDSAILLTLGMGAQALQLCVSPKAATLFCVGATASPSNVLAQGSKLGTQRFSGVDEQGWYWGTRFSIPQSALAGANIPSLPNIPFAGMLAKVLNGKCSGSSCTEKARGQFVFVSY